MNGTTNEERTLYFETLPKNQLDLMLYLEADRMRGLDISKENLDNQRHAVQEERRLRLENQPYGKMSEKFGETMYDNFAYKHSVIGSMEDLNAASVEDVREFSASITRRTTRSWPSSATSRLLRRSPGSKHISSPSHRNPRRPGRRGRAGADFRTPIHY